MAEDILGAAFDKKALVGQHFPTEGFPPASGRSFKGETKQVQEGLVSEKHRQEDQCNDPGKSEGNREPEVGVNACQEQGAQWEGSLWKRELGAVILSRLTEIGPGAGTRGHSQ